MESLSCLVETNSRCPEVGRERRPSTTAALGRKRRPPTTVHVRNRAQRSQHAKNQFIKNKNLPDKAAGKDHRILKRHLKKCTKVKTDVENRRLLQHLPSSPNLELVWGYKSGRPLLARYKTCQNNLSTHCRELSGCFKGFRWYQVIVCAWYCHWLERRHIFLLIRSIPQRIFSA